MFFINTVTNIFLLYKITRKEFIKKLAQGEVFFSCCGRYVDIAKAGCDKGQGDKFECVFAKYLKKNSRKPIQVYKKLFGKDLKIESDGDYILFRRKSSLLTPTACFYSIDNETAINNLQGKEKECIEQILTENQDKEKVTIEKFPLTIPQIYLDEFNLNDDELDAMIIQPGLFLPALTAKNVTYRKIAYIDTNKEFDIFEDELYLNFYGKLTKSEAIEKRIEMFFKDKENYSHQCEFRCIISNTLFKNHSQGKTVKISGLTSMESNVGNTQNATGKDFICNVKNDVFFAKVTMEKKK